MQEYDRDIREGLEGILNAELKGSSWQQCVLPVRKGGLGIRSAMNLALPAFLSPVSETVAGVENLLPDNIVGEVYQELVEAESLWGEIIPDSALQPTDKAMQAQWDIPLYER